MAKHPSHILDMARKGATHRYEELKAEIAKLVKNFPHLADVTRTKLSEAVDAVEDTIEAGVDKIRGRRKMSAAARKKISDAQKARWQRQKAKK